MENKLDNLFQKFSKKGFLPIEVPGLVKDAVRLFENDLNCSIATVDQELEELGWGIGVMDDEAYKLIAALVRNSGLSDVERYLSRT